MSRISKPMETEDGRRQKLRMTTNRYGVSFKGRGDGVLELDGSDGQTALWIYQNHQTVCLNGFKIARFMVSFPCGSAGKESASDAGVLGLLSGLGKSPREGKSYLFQYSGLENSMDYIVHGVTKSLTWLSDFHSHVLWYVHFISVFFNLPIWEMEPNPIRQAWEPMYSMQLR